jgi:xanthine dehydrogenase molybdenum-binding subunit
VDGPSKVTGRARYTDDMGLPGMRCAKYVRSPLAHARVKSIDAAKALALPGVQAVFTFKDVPEIMYASAGHPWHLDPGHRDVADRYLLTDHPRCHGDPVAVVVARDELTAEKAARLVEVDYEELPVVTTPEAALAGGAPLLHPGGNLLRSHHFTCGGDPEALMAQARVVTSGRYRTPIAAHCQLENHTAYAYMEDDKRITIVSSTQIPHICRRIAAQALGLPWSRIRVVKPCIGGGFGAKQDAILEPMAAFLTFKLGGLPVKMALTREECMLGTTTRHAFDLSGRMGVDGEGRITAVCLDVTSNTGAYASHGHSIVSAGGAKCPSLYPRAAFGFKASTVYTNMPVAGAMRGYGSPQVHFALDCLAEQAAREIGMDPIEFRLKNVGLPGEVNPLNKKVITTHGMAECLKKGRELFDWDKRRAATRDQSGPVRLGFGVACGSFNSGVYPISSELSGARVLLNQDATVQLMAGATEIGQGADTVFAQMAAQVLGISLSSVNVVSTQDTDITPFDPGSFASRQTFTASPAVKGAALALRERILAHAALMAKRSADGLSISDGIVLDESGASLMSLEELALDAFYNKERGGQLSGECSYKTRANPPSFCCTFALVEVDIPMCRARLVDMLNVHDAGTIMNHKLAEGQVAGGMAMGAGWALTEEMIVDASSGIVRNNNLLDYKLPTCLDLPEMRAAFVETNEPSAAFGGKSLGEPPLLSPAPAIRNAVWDATGVRIDEIPMTSKALFRRFKEAGII